MDSTDFSRPYPAVKLDLHDRQIRLISLLPGRYVDSVTCDLRTVSLDNPPNYYSLSYAWGDRSDLRQILLNGVSFNVTRNLEASLRRLRHPTKTLLFWIDMLCIDQECVEERTHQVNLMQHIYSMAQEVFLWLGDYPEIALPKADYSLRPIAEDQEDLTQMEAVRALSHIERLSADLHLEFPEQGAIPLRLVEEIHALEKFMNCSWWHRIWTVQEAILPPKVTVQFGWLQIPWAKLAAAATNLRKHHNLECCYAPKAHESFLHTFFQKVDCIQEVRISYHSGRCPSLTFLLHQFRDRLSTDPRDKIFALLGLVVRDVNYRSLQADYTLSTEVTYQNAFMFLLQDEGTLNLLVRQAELERKLDLPTWMPDWSAEVDKSNNSTRILVRQSLTRYKAALNTRSEIRWPSTIKTLSVKGFLFDDVAILADPVPDNFEMTDNYIEYLENLLNITGSQSQSYIGGGDLPQAIWRLLTMDLTVVHTRRPASSSVQRATTEDYLKSRIAHPPHGVPINIKSFVGVFRFFISRMGYIGLGPVNMRVGDTIHVFLGASVPFVLRQTTQQIAVSGPETEYEYIGNCYVQGIMDGEALYDADLENLGWVNLV